MCCMRFTMFPRIVKNGEHQLKTVQHLGTCARSSILAIFAVIDGRVRTGRCGLRVPEKTVIKRFACSVAMASRVHFARSPQGAPPN